MEPLQTELAWRTSTFSGEHDNCVEVACLPDGGWAVRDSKDRRGAVLEFTAVEWNAFVDVVKSGEFDG
ncbi:DUF397 domain-containing protein [Streptosporangium carneum]|uniref:DUF397 domain-containing protein n=1 Tax=Streptosporangium carneum TaxID=47481 RepID=A0A9W6I811_9ACTN|nr:DUF397 domain-containing protein [Streptosporangium carneum]GLK13786.1 hypothetical protein GCM10017600_71970 [Streptosporangium carneum]